MNKAQRILNIIGESFKLEYSEPEYIRPEYSRIALEYMVDSLKIFQELINEIKKLDLSNGNVSLPKSFVNNYSKYLKAVEDVWYKYSDAKDEATSDFDDAPRELRYEQESYTELPEDGIYEPYDSLKIVSEVNNILDSIDSFIKEFKKSEKNSDDRVSYRLDIYYKKYPDAKICDNMISDIQKDIQMIKNKMK